MEIATVHYILDIYMHLQVKIIKADDLSSKIFLQVKHTHILYTTYHVLAHYTLLTKHI